MAATVTEIGSSAVSANPASAPSAATTASVAVGEILFMLLALLGNGTTAASATATAGGSAMTQDAIGTRGVGTANPTIWLFRFEPASTLASASTVAATVTNAGPGSTMKLIKVAGLTTGVGLDATAGTNNGLSQTPTTGATGTPPSGDEVFSLAALASNVGATGGTPPGNTYTALTDLTQATRLVTLYSAWKDLSPAVAAQNESWTPSTWGANKNWAAIDALYRVTAGGGGGVTVQQLAALGVG